VDKINLQCKIHHKSTSTSMIVYNACHPVQCKMTAVNFMITRVNMYPVIKNRRKTLVEYKLYNSGTPENHRITEQNVHNQKSGLRSHISEIKSNYKNVQRHKYRIAFRTFNIMQQEKQHENNKYDNDGIFRLMLLLPCTIHRPSWIIIPTKIPPHMNNTT
jgi:hypothetical protein